MSDDLDVQDWQPLTVPEAVSAMRGAACRWWIAGGWSIDLFLGRQTRDHADTDVLVLTSEQLAAQQHLSDWVLYKTKQPTPTKLALWPAEEYLAPETDIHDIWIKREVGGPWRFQLMFTEDDADRWVFRRDRRIGGALADLGWTHPDGFEVLRPEVQLLYKARPEARRSKDQADFESVADALTPTARVWLAEALMKQYGPTHDWLPRLTTKERFGTAESP
ncbi:MAG: hypothetical protein AAGA25_10200 [Planctomycetota bacterium]